MRGQEAAKAFVIVLALLSVGFCVSGLAGDVVWLKNGDRVEGRVIRETESQITIDFGCGEMTLDRKNIEKIQKAEKKPVPTEGEQEAANEKGAAKPAQGKPAKPAAKPATQAVKPAPPKQAQAKPAPPKKTKPPASEGPAQESAPGALPPAAQAEPASGKQ